MIDLKLSDNQVDMISESARRGGRMYRNVFRWENTARSLKKRGFFEGNIFLIDGNEAAKLTKKGMIIAVLLEGWNIVHEMEKSNI